MEISDKYLSKTTTNAPNSQNPSGLVNLKYANIKLYQDNLITHLPRTRQVKSLSPMSQVLKLIHFSWEDLTHTLRKGYWFFPHAELQIWVSCPHLTKIREGRVKGDMDHGDKYIQKVRQKNIYLNDLKMQGI